MLLTVFIASADGTGVLGIVEYYIRPAEVVNYYSNSLAVKRRYLGMKSQGSAA